MKYLTATFHLHSDDLSSDMSDTAFDLLAYLGGEAGFETFEREGEVLKGYVQEELFDKDLLSTLLSDFPLPGVTVSYSMEQSEYKDWNEEWESEGFEPIEVGGRCIIHDTKHAVEHAEGMIDVVIDARMAFGTGTHSTTQMMVAQLLSDDLQGKRVLDCGCGTGILSIVASKAGASEVVAYDIDEWSVENTRHNASLNQVTNIVVLCGARNVLTHVSGVFDHVIANINRNILLQDMGAMREVMSASGRLTISGFYESDTTILMEEATRLGLKLQSKMSLGDWVSLSFCS
ncbi:MAG: 50S ribosomal protein L11 methyltransferase [Prevotella sp.]|nr:50S ribosomal protein L11 methyltransferase [Prevotella sp.]